MDIMCRIVISAILSLFLWTIAGPEPALAFQDNGEAHVTGFSWIAGIGLLGLIIFASYIFLARRNIFRLLDQLRNAAQNMAAGEYCVSISGLDRKDAIGQLATALNQLREQLEAKHSDELVEFKDAFFAGSPDACLITDQNFLITSINPSGMTFFQTHADAFRKVDPEFDPESLLGSNMDLIMLNQGQKDIFLDQPRAVPHSVDIHIGNEIFEVCISSYFDQECKYVGNILAWSAVTEQRLQDGVFAATDITQSVAEFTTDGELISANDLFLSTMGYSADELKGCHHRLFVDAADDEGGFWDNLRRDGFFADKCRFVSKSGEVVWVDAVYTTLRDKDRHPYRVVMLAKNITEIETKRRLKELSLAAVTKEQEEIVATLAEGLCRLSNGDLTTQIGSTGEHVKLSSDFNEAVAKLHDVMKAIISNTIIIKSGASELSQSADDLSQRTENQAASLEGAAFSLEQITETVNAAAEGTNQAYVVVSQARENAEVSRKVVSQAVSAMNEIEDSSRQISQIIGVIEEIAFQTNLLALNASVEAARAGDAGLGFAVVASEVRALAQRSSNAAKEIKSLISTSSQQVKTGVDLVGQAKNALQQMIDKVVDISGLVADIASSTQEQANGLKAVNVAVNQMDHVTQQNASMVEASTAACHCLTQQAETLIDLVKKFHITSTPHECVRLPERRTLSARQEMTIAQQQQRAVTYATSQGSASLKSEMCEDDDDWQEF